MINMMNDDIKKELSKIGTVEVFHESANLFSLLMTNADYTNFNIIISINEIIAPKWEIFSNVKILKNTETFYILVISNN